MRGLISRDLLVKILLGGLLVFAVYSNISLVVHNNKLGQVLREKKTETTKQASNNKKLKLLISYYQTPSYQEVEARRRLGLKKPDETVYAVRGLPTGNTPNSTLSDNLYNDIQPSPAAPKTNIQQWWEYFFGE